MQLHRLACSYISLHAVTRACMQLQELACSYRSLHAVPLTFMKFNGLTWSSMSLHAVSWACMQFLSFLSSSQEFHSACFVKRGNSFLTYLAGRGNSFQRGFNSYVIFISTSCGSRYWGHRVKSCVWCLCRGGGPE